MNAMETLIRDLGSQIDALDEGNYGEVILDPPCRNSPRLQRDVRAFPEPDVYLEPPDERQVMIRASDHQINGCYIAMQSPGQVILIGKNIEQSYWQLVCQLCGRVAYLTKADLHAAAELVVMSTYHHELFHFYSDVLRQLFGSTYGALMEEALAVAWARQVIIETRGKWQTKIARMNGLFYRLVLDEAFNYQSPGYRDWP